MTKMELWSPIMDRHSLSCLIDVSTYVCKLIVISLEVHAYKLYILWKTML